jgi:hypothetical protein
MSKYDKLQQQSDDAYAATKKEVANFYTIANESRRVADVACNAGMIISDIDKDFAKATKLNNKDISFLFLATALQCVRQYVFTNDAFRFDTASDSDKAIKGNIKKIIPKHWSQILLGSVPYDAVHQTDEFKTLNIKTGIGGTTHRYRTLGHDPILGWVFGPMNILSDSLTKSDFVTTYSVMSNKISGIYPEGTYGAFNNAIGQIQADKWNLPASIGKQAIHFGSDYFTKQGLPIPLIGSINNDFSKLMTTKFNIDLYSVSRSVLLSTLINQIVFWIHTFFYDEQKDISRELYEVRTRKILSYSNLIASVSNVIVVAIGAVAGVTTENSDLIKKSLQKLDIGGILVTIYRLISDYNFIKNVKEEFLSNQWYNIVMREEYNF